MGINGAIEQAKLLITKISDVGKNYTDKPKMQGLFPFEHYLDKCGNIDKEFLNKNDGLWTRREILTRYLLVRAVLDQGPDVEGVRIFVRDVVNALYKKEIRIFHKPLEFFKEIGISINEILERHASVKKIRATEWAKENESTANRYNLFIDGSKQVLGYAIYRWGVPLCVPLLLEKDLQKSRKQSSEPLVDYIEKWNSAEIMSKQIKDNERYGLGKAIGDKAGHLFVKWYIHTFGLRKREDKAFGPLSYEVPFDSNAGRVLFRSGFLLCFAKLSDYESWEVIQKGKGKSGEHHIRVTNIRGKKSTKYSNLKTLMNSYSSICIDYFKVRKRRPSKLEIQQIPNALLLGTDYSIGDLDDGLMHIGTKYCLNHANPKCKLCPINDICVGRKTNNKLILRYRT